MTDSSTFWLTFMNAALGVVTLIACGAVGFSVVRELAARRKKSAALARLDHEVSDLVASFDGHAFDVPGLGLTMADGGEELKDKKEER